MEGEFWDRVEVIGWIAAFAVAGILIALFA